MEKDRGNLAVIGYAFAAVFGFVFGILTGLWF
jgi:hypothetical protein